MKFQTFTANLEQWLESESSDSSSHRPRIGDLLDLQHARGRFVTGDLNFLARGKSAPSFRNPQISRVALVLGTRNFSIAAQTLRFNSDFFMNHPCLQSYTVQTQVAPQTFEVFLRALEEDSDLHLTADNLPELSRLCEEFGVPKLKRVWDHFVQSPPAVSSRDFHVENIESQFEDLKREFHLLKDNCRGLRAEVRQLTHSVGDLPVSRQIETLKTSVAQSLTRLETLRPELPHLNAVFRQLQHGFERFEGWLPLKEAKSLDGSDHEKGIVIISSNSVLGGDSKDSAKYVADLTSDSAFYSKDEPGEWICWDFREMRDRPTHSAMWTWGVKSWVVEGSIDGWDVRCGHCRCRIRRNAASSGSLRRTRGTVATISCAWKRSSSLGLFRRRFEGSTGLGECGVDELMKVIGSLPMPNCQTRHISNRVQM
jgi:hypothetical protein